MTRALFFTMCVAALLGCPKGTRADDGSNGRSYAVALAITETHNGLQTTLAQPTLIVKEGQEGSFLAGEEIPVDADKSHNVEVGTHARLTITQKADKLRVALKIGKDDMAEKTDDDVVVHQTATQCMKTIKPGETFVIDMGDGRQAKVTVLAIGSQPSQVASVKD